MHVIVDFCLIPVGVGVSVSEYVAKCQAVLTERGLTHVMHAYGTNVEGEWEEVFGAIEECHRTIHEMGAPRISTSIRLGTRIDRVQSMQEKIDSVNDKRAL